MTKYVEIALVLPNRKKTVNCYSCKHQGSITECLKLRKTECVENNYSHYEYKAEWWEKVVRIYEEED